MIQLTTWKVKAIQVGTIDGALKGVLHFGGDPTPVLLPMWVVAATDGVHKVLIDTGIDDLAEVVKGPEPFAHQKPEENTLVALKDAMGWAPEDVDAVINTHLHFDHCGCNKYFKNAKLYVQRREWVAAHNPIPSNAQLYYEPYFSKKGISYFQWSFLDGETEIYPGLIVIPTPGHTYGHQSVLLNTQQGTLCVAGDVVSCVENINLNMETNIVIDPPAVYESFRSIREKADRIIPGHEFKIRDRAEQDFPEII